MDSTFLGEDSFRRLRMIKVFQADDKAGVFDIEAKTKASIANISLEKARLQLETEKAISEHTIASLSKETPLMQKLEEVNKMIELYPDEQLWKDKQTVIKSAIADSLNVTKGT